MIWQKLNCLVVPPYKIDNKCLPVINRKRGIRINASGLVPEFYFIREGDVLRKFLKLYFNHKKNRKR